MARASANWLWVKYEDNLGGETVSDAVAGFGWDSTGGNRTGTFALRGAETPGDDSSAILLYPKVEARRGWGKKTKSIYYGPLVGESLVAALRPASTDT